MPEPQIVQVEVLAAAPNPLWTDEERAVVCFLRYTHAVPCAACGKRTRHHWTMRVSFATVNMDTLVARPSETVHLPLVPVCRAHPLAPAALPVAAQRVRGKETPHA